MEGDVGKKNSDICYSANNTEGEKKDGDSRGHSVLLDFYPNEDTLPSEAHSS